jgi:P4 family phage/plasmid primase-like protien
LTLEEESCSSLLPPELDKILSNLFALINKYGTNPQSSSFEHSEEKEYYNSWADFWRYVIGINVIPADTKAKKPIIKWSQYQNNPISEVQYIQWKTKGAYLKGMGIIPGKVWHRPDKTGEYFTIIDLDRATAIKELCTRIGKTISLDIMAQKFLVEQHKDNLEKAHVCFYSKIPFPQKSSDSVLGMEIKGLGEHGIMYCSCSIHQNKNSEDMDEHRYEIVSIPKVPVTISMTQSIELMQHINQVCLKYGIDYLKRNSKLSKLKPMIKTLTLDPMTKVSEGERHPTLLSAADSLLLTHLNKQRSEEELKDFFICMNKHVCEPPLPDREIQEIWKSAKEFTIKKREESQLVEEPQEKKKNNNPLTKVSYYTEELLCRHKFVTLEDSMEILHYDHGVYLPKGEQLIKKELEEIGGYNININIRREIIEHIRNKRIVNRSEFDKGPNIINLENGLYHITEDRLTEHTPDYLSMVQKPIPYDKETKSDLFDKFVNDIVYPDDVRTLKECMAYTFFRDNPFEYYFVRHGKGGNGKGVCDIILIALHGMQCVSNIKLEILQNNRFAKSHLIGKDVNVDPELSSGRIKDLAALKELTGQIPIFVEAKGKDGYEVRLHTKHFFSANEYPSIEDDTDAHHRREIIISFPYTYELIAQEQQQSLNDKSEEVRKADPHLGEKLTTKNELSGIFNILMDSLRTVLKNDGIYLSAKTIEQRRTKSKIATDSIGEFQKRGIAKDSIYDQDALTKDITYRAYKQFCRSNGVVFESQQKFGRKMKERYKDGREGMGERRTFWWGVKLVDKYREQFADNPPLELHQLQERELSRKRGTEYAPFVSRDES